MVHGARWPHDSRDHRESAGAENTKHGSTFPDSQACGHTIVADVADTACLWHDEKLSGLCATVSFAGHHRQLGTRVSLPSGECDAWASEIVGEESAPYLYRAGTLSGPGRMSSVYYRLFLNEAGNPGQKPESIVQEQLRHISES